MSGSCDSIHSIIIFGLLVITKRYKKNKSIFHWIYKFKKDSKQKLKLFGKVAQTVVNGFIFSKVLTNFEYLQL